MNVVFEIEGREAIPVRAIPYVTGWQWPRGISPDSLAKALGRHPNERTPFDGLRTSSAYKMYLGKSVAVRPEEWNKVVVQLEGFSADLKARFPEDEQGRSDARGYAAWQSNAAQKLPSGVFVWLDELEKDFHRYFDWIARQVPADSLGSRDLNLAPLLLTDDVRRMMSEGFEEFTGIHGNPSAKDSALASDGTRYRKLMTWRPASKHWRKRAMATSLETRLEKLECAQVRATGREYTDAERAVRLAWALENGGPTADRLLAILAGADKRTNEHEHT